MYNRVVKEGGYQNEEIINEWGISSGNVYGNCRS